MGCTTSSSEAFEGPIFWWSAECLGESSYHDKASLYHNIIHFHKRIGSINAEVPTLSNETENELLASKCVRVKHVKNCFRCKRETYREQVWYMAQSNILMNAFNQLTLK